MAQSPKDRQPEEPPPRRARADAVGGDAALAARSVFVRAGFSDPTLVLRWREIAGPDTARLARPVKLSEGPSGGVLTLRAEPAAALFLQHESRSLCERINAFLGRQAVTKLRFVQGSLTSHPAPPIRRRPSEPPSNDPARTWHGPAALGNALLNLARMRNRGRGPD
ncbi:MAG TPA: DciA family protein [Rhizomicrobium sp.]|nr:DciA family protein [Rhizomicrobium sp.]